MKLAEGAIFLFLDDDCVPRANWIEQHLYRQSQGESIVGGAVEFGRESYLQLADNLSAFHDLLPYTSPGYRTYLATANLSIHHSVVADIGEMDTSQIRSEDLEWTARMRSRGYKLYFDPSAVVYHDPNRYSLKPFIQHWVNDAPGTLRVRLRYSDLLGTPALARYRAAYLWGAPFVAGWATLRTFSHPQSVRRYWHTIPMVYLTKLIWCLSAFRDFPCQDPL
jgi:GT2 family glycosyltransferase